MACKDVSMDDGGVNVDDIHSQGVNGDASATATDGRAKRSNKQRRRIPGGGGGGGGGKILRNLTRRGSLGSYLNESFDPDDQITMADRKLVLKCQVKLTVNSLTRSRFLFLYDDVLICAKQKSSTSFHIKNRVDLRDIWLNEDDGDASAADSSSSKVNSVSIGWPITNADLEFPTAEQKNVCVEKLRTLLTTVREKESPNVIVRLVKNGDKYSVTRSVLVGNCETAKSVLTRCTKEFHNASDTNEFQLQAVMNKTETPILLSGREILYRIQMKYNREHSDGCKDSATESESEAVGDGIVFHLIPLEKKSTLLKRSMASDDNKPAKRASPLARFFRMAFKMADDGRLYRRNLSELCKDGHLCWRLMMMLSHLYLNGPSYEEVFRKPPALKVHRMLQEKLDRGKDFNFDKVNACEMSQLLKSFLSLLPECLLTTELYDEWSEVPKQKSRSTMKSLAKSLVDRLPEPNLVFLRHLMCVLHRIASHCDVNGMPAKSLSICIGQCILWFPPLKPSSTGGVTNELRSELHRFGIANSVTEILIDNVVDVFGENCLHLFDHLHRRQPLLPSSSSSNTRENNSTIISSSIPETENTGFRSGLVRESSSDRSGVPRSVSCLNYSTVSLTDEVKHSEFELLHEVSEEMALKLNSTWHLSGTAFGSRSPLVVARTEQSLNSSQMDLFPEKRAIKEDDDEEEEEENEELEKDDDEENETEKDDDEEKEIEKDDDEEKEELEKYDDEEWNVKIESTSEPFLTVNQEDVKGLPAEEGLLSLSEIEAPFTPDHLNSLSSRESFILVDAVSTEPAAKESIDDLCQIHSASDNECSKSKSTVTAAMPPGPSVEDTFPDSIYRSDSLSSPPDPEAARSVRSLDSSPVIQMLVFAEEPGTSGDPAEDNIAPVFTSRNDAENLGQSAEIQSKEIAQSSSVSSPTIESTRRHLQPQDGIALPSVRPGPGSGSESQLNRNAKRWIVSRTEVQETNASTSDDGYCSPSNTISRGHVTGREFDLLPSSLERSFLVYAEDPGLNKLCPKNTLGVNRTKSAPSDSGHRSEVSTGRSLVPSDLSVTPPGIVRRLTSQIAERESALNSPPPIPSSPKLATHRKKVRSPSFKGTPSADDGPSSCSNCNTSSDTSATSDDHFQLEHSSRIPCRSEFLQGSDLGKCRFEDQDPDSNSRNLLPYDDENEQPSYISHSVKSSDDIQQRITSIGSCSEVRSSVGEESTKRNAEPIKDLKKPQTISPPNPQDAVPADTRSSKVVADESVQGIGTTVFDANGGGAPKKSSKPRQHNSDPKITAPNNTKRTIERSHSDICGIATTDEDTMNKENKENLLRYQQLKRLSITRQTSTPVKVSKISAEPNEPWKHEDEISCSPETKNMSVKNRDWHRELTEQYKAPATAAAAATVDNSNTVSQTRNEGKKPSQRSALIAPKISFTPMPLRVFQGNASKVTATTTRRKT